MRPGTAEEARRLEAALLEELRADLPQATNGSLTLVEEVEGRVVAGLTGRTSYGWLHVDVLWVARAARRQGHGRRLMQAALDEARAMRCHGVWLDTSNPAACAFYLALGFEDFGCLANGDGQHPETHRRWFLRRSAGMRDD